MKEASIETTMESNGIGPAGSAGIKKGDTLDTPFKSCPASAPALAGVNAINDRNQTPEFSNPRSSGGIPVKFYETVSGSPGTLESTLEDKNLVR